MSPMRANADLTLYSTDFDAMSYQFSLSGQEFWETSDPDQSLGFGASDGIATLASSAGQTKAGFLGGFFRAQFPPGKTEVFLGPRIQTLGPSVKMEVDLVLVGSQASGDYSADDSFGWSVRDSGGVELFRIAFEPTASSDDRREIVAYDENGIRMSSNFDLFTGAPYRLGIEISSEPGGDRVTTTIGGNELTFADPIIPAGSISSIAQFAAVWKMASAVVAPSTGIVSGFGNNIMAFDDYSITATAPGVAFAANVTVQESAGTANLKVAICAALAQDLEVFYTTSDLIALAGADYDASNSTSQPLVIPSGSLTASISIPIVDDSIAEAGERFTVELTGTDGAVTVGSPTVLVNIVDNDDADGDGMSNLWEDAFGLDADEDDAGEDFDSDGITNLLEYAVGLDPTAFDSTTPFELIRSTSLSFRYPRDRSYTNLDYRVEVSDDLISWVTVPDSLISTDGQIETREAVIATISNHQFVRLSIRVVE